MFERPTNVGHNRFAERDRFLIPAVRVLNALVRNPHAACHLAHSTELDRATVDRAVQWLKRRGLIEHDGAWKLTGLGRAAVSVKPQRDEEPGG